MSVNLLLAENFTGTPSRANVQNVAQAGLKPIHDSLASSFPSAGTYIYMTPCPLSFYFNI